MVFWYHRHISKPWGTFPPLWCTWDTLSVRVFRSPLILVACGWSLDLTCLYFGLMGILWSLVWGCLGIRALAGIIVLGGVAGKWKLAGNHLFLFVCLFVCLFVVQLHAHQESCLGLSGDQSPCRDHNIWKSGRQIEDSWESTFMFYLFVVQHQAHPPPERMQSIEGKSKDVAEWEQKAAGRAGWPGGILWWRKEFCDETSKNIHPKCKAAAGRMMCIRGRLPSWLTIHIDNPM